MQKGAEHLVDGAGGKFALDVQMAEHDDRPSLPIPIFERMVQMQIEAGRSVAVAIRFTAKQRWRMGLQDDEQPAIARSTLLVRRGSAERFAPVQCESRKYRGRE